MIKINAHAKVGKDIIKDDPNKMTGNGKLLMDILKKQNLNGITYLSRQKALKIYITFRDYYLFGQAYHKLLSG